MIGKKKKLLATIVFLSIGAMTIFVPDYIESYYQKLGTKVPKWIMRSAEYILFGGLMVAAAKFVEVFEKESKNGSKAEK